MKIERTNFQGSWDDICPYCGEKQEAHREVVGEYEGKRYEHRMPCDAEKKQIIKEARLQAGTLKVLVFIGWIFIPIIVGVVGFASFFVGVILFIISMFKIAWTGVTLYGRPEKWFPMYKSKIEKERKMHHYYYHCEKNPDGFRKLFIENLSDEKDL